MRRLGIVLAALGLAATALAIALATRATRPLFEQILDPREFESVAIADPERAITFARRRSGTGHQLLLVTGWDDGWFTVIDPNLHLGTTVRSPIELLARHGYDALAGLARSDAPRRRIAENELDVPLPLDGDRHVAAGTNFAAHGAEAGLDEPFVFPKRSVPTRWDAPVPKGGARRLDYEVELCFVPLARIPRPGGEPSLGVLLCNDFTDRWSLVAGLLGGEGEIGTRGFADGKGAPGFLPVGPLLVVPRSLDEFLAGVELSLWVNGRLRQRALAGAMIWSPHRIIDEAFARTDWDFHHRGRVTRLLPEGGIPTTSLILSGTPEGVVFRPAWFWWAPPFLEPGDQVVAKASYLGRLRNEITR